MDQTTKTGTMNVMDPTGHSEITWNASVDAEVKNARRSFDDLTKAGYQAFRLNENDERGSRMTTFDPDAEKILMVPQLKGG